MRTIDPSDDHQPTDGELAARCRQQDGCPEADEEILQRYQGLGKTVVCQLGHELHLSAEEQEDGRQIADIGIWKAAHGFDPSHQDPSGRGCFPAYANQAVRRHCSNWVRGILRAEQHLDRSQDADTVLETGPDRRPDETPASGVFRHHAPDPSWEAEHNEDLARLDQAIDRLDAEERWLLDQWREGKRFTQIADELGITYKKVLAQRARLLRKLGRLVGGLPAGQ